MLRMSHNQVNGNVELTKKLDFWKFSCFIIWEGAIISIRLGLGKFLKWTLSSQGEAQC